MSTVSAKWLPFFQSLIAIEDSTSPLRMRLPSPRQSIISALKSKEIPIRGWKDGAYTRLEKETSQKSEFDLLLNLTNLSGRVLGDPYAQGSYTQCEVGYGELVSWLLANSIPNDMASPIFQEASKDRANVKKAFRAFIEGHRTCSPPGKQQLFLAIQSGNFPEIGDWARGISKSIFDQVWREYAPPSWKNPGSKNKQSPHWVTGKAAKS